ncbi:MAG TPA: 3'-5' exonuclease, partial [Pyrinomonadaceae bacterium]|nr:3'-5' exonuclease [Pyrinomonadaceae bacterium]
LKLAMNPHDSIALQRIINTPPRGIGKVTLDEIENRARELGISYWDAISDLLSEGRNVSPRAAAALANFQRIINRLARQTEQVMSRTESVGSDDDEQDINPNVSERLENDYESTSPVSDLVKAAILDTGYENALKSEASDEAEGRLENLQELVNAAVDYDDQGAEGLRDFIDHSALVADTDQYKADVPVTLMTAHSAKGLEFPVVFLVGLEDGLFPHSRSLSDSSDIEEERRLAYVAMTRAERFLYITHAVKRRVYGEELASEPSQFLNEMPLELIDDLSRGRSWLSFARGSKDLDEAAGSLRYEYDDDYGSDAQSTVDEFPRKPGNKYGGKTYNSVESVNEFFRRRDERLGFKSPSGYQSQGSRAKARSANPTHNPLVPTSSFVPGSYVRHAKYGRGLVLRREGSGDQTKVTVSFPGYGAKKLIEKYANLEQD